jgi:AraC-like DNA-binding protein
MTAPFFRVYYVAEGSATVVIQGAGHKLVSGYVYFIPCVYPFLNICGKEMRVHWFHALPSEPWTETLIAGVREPHRWSLGSFGLFKELILDLGNGDFSAGGSKWMELQSFALSVISRLMRKRAGNDLRRGAPAAVRKGLEYMDSRYTENPSLERIAAAASLAPVYFHRLFKKHCGVSPFAVMERKRMGRAVSLLNSTDMTLAEIASRTGYKNEFYFSRVFKKYFKVSPGKARGLFLSP